MPQFAPQLIQDMRNALEDVMTRVPTEYSTTAVKVATKFEFVINLSRRCCA